MYEKTFPNKRFQKTITFLKKVAPSDTKKTILDLGVRNPFVPFMEAQGYEVTNTSGQDLDNDTTQLKNTKTDLVTAFEIFEHLLSPYTVLKDIQADTLVCSVPLKLWFAKAYRSKTDQWDMHYHEFEDWQFDWLLEKAGWHIEHREKFTHPVKKIGLRPLLRLWTPRYYLVHATRKS